ncbi:hypothetical protein [Syntrophotalea acetylenica]|uniref:Uncharacterized protein n=1 Tax=Syntrophotalea acetylenica TaxID=29542 RepID=A0A1L3GDP9_SYNAC|nr:hypothetical protein [Syntrophotalea acetylenica]APG24076.1 hypothetical protein A7E75_02810 [Syntrophotalea acetylenica]APG44658.1 hypothetical protein A6070_11435 [Syntrophotalea acetylenica]APG45458.1 hypothetical protein A6070_14860 [Syntrophotalea acetylenica]
MSLQRPSSRRGSSEATRIFTASDIDDWMAAHTVRCERLGSRIEPGFCKSYRQDRIACHGCLQAAEMDRLAQGHKEIIKEEVDVGTGETKACLECRATGKRIIGRGLCGACYSRLRASGGLDAKYPKGGRATASNPETGVTPSPTVETDEEVEQPTAGQPVATIATRYDDCPGITAAREWAESRLCPEEGADPSPTVGTEETVAPPTTPRPVKVEGPLSDSQQGVSAFDQFVSNAIASIQNRLSGVTPEDVLIDGLDFVHVRFLPGDADLLAFLQGWAREERRTVEQQILAILDNAKAAADKETI